MVVNRSTLCSTIKWEYFVQIFVLFWGQTDRVKLYTLMTSKQQFRLILGSSSPWRKRILSQLGYTFDVISPDIDEKGFFSVPQHSKTIIL